MEALKAQAVAARTYAVQRKIAAWGRPYHLSATVLSQVYGGARSEDARTREAVRATGGEVLVWRMEPIEAYFHGSCGGHTESGREALGRDLPYLQSVDCPCGGLAQTSWTRRLGSKDFARVMSELPQLRVTARTASGRVKTVELVAGRTRRTLTGVDLRRLVGYDTIRSLNFDAERQGASLVLRGKGYGHGAGMCQWGAKVLAERGEGYRAILAHYYPGAELRRMY
jgi:stage II sporulation protein D